MLKILTIIGARPQIIKSAALSRAIRNGFSSRIAEKILHTGQHYDSNMSQIFFDELGIPQPDYNLHVGFGSHGEQTAKMITGIEKVLQSERFDALVVWLLLLMFLVSLYNTIGAIAKKYKEQLKLDRPLINEGELIWEKRKEKE